MMQFKVTQDKKLILMNKTINYINENNANSLYVYLPKTISGRPTTETRAYLCYERPDTTWNMIDLFALGYEEDDDKFIIHGDIDWLFTSVDGVVEVWIKFLDNRDAMIAKTNTIKVLVADHIDHDLEPTREQDITVLEQTLMLSQENAENLEAHTSNTEIHVTQSQKDGWDKSISDLNEMLNVERTDRIQAIKNESDARKEADTALDGKISDEASARSAADTSLNNKITTESNTRYTEDSRVLAEAKVYTNNQVQAEATLRQQGDTATYNSAKEYTDGKNNEVKQLIQNEATTRANEDSVLSARIGSEVDNRIAAVEALDNKKQDNLGFVGSYNKDTNPVTTKSYVDEKVEQGGKVKDVKVNGESVVDENKSANIDLTGYAKKNGDRDEEFEAKNIYADKLSSTSVSVSNINATGEITLETGGGQFVHKLSEKSNATNIENGSGEYSLQQTLSESTFNFQENPYLENEDKGVLELGALSKHSVALQGRSRVTGRKGFATGTGTISAGDYSTAIGTSTYAKGNSSVAEGFVTYAKGVSSHAEGKGTQAIGNYSHSEGEYSKAQGTSSHSEGEETNSIGYASHSEGKYSVASGNVSHAEGLHTESQGDHSHSEGYDTKAIGENSHTEGSITQTYASSSHAEGMYTSAGGDFISPPVVPPVDPSDTPSPPITHPDEDKPTSGTIYDNLKVGASHSEGYRTTAYGFSSHAEGNNTLAKNYNSHAEGTHTKTYADSSHAEGIHTTAGLEEDLSKAKGSHAEGYYTIAIGDAAHAEGSYANAIGDSSHAEGKYTNASGDSSHAEGEYTEVNGDYSHAEGHHSTSNGESSHAEGYYTIANGSLSHVEGGGTVANGYCQHVQGQYNAPNENMAHIVGGGSSDTNRKNIHTLDWQGNAYFAGDVEANGQKLSEKADKSTTYTKDEVDAKLSTVYKYAGTKTVAEVNALDKSKLATGDTYNISDSGTITNTTGHANIKVEASDNISWIKTSTSSPYGYWDELSSDIDLSGYALKGGSISQDFAAKDFIGTSLTLDNSISMGGGLYLLNTDNFSNIVPSFGDNLQTVLDSKAVKSETYTKTEIDNKLVDAGKITDVKVNGTSVVTNKVANIDLSGKADVVTIVDKGDISAFEITDEGSYRFKASADFTATGAKFIGLHCANGTLKTTSGFRYYVDVFRDGSTLIGEVSGYEAS